MSSGQIADENCVLVKVEREVIDKLDELICEGRGDDEYKQLFTTAYVLTTGPPNGPVLFYRLSYVSVCRLSASFVVVCNAAGAGRPAAGRVDGRRAGDRARGWSGGRHSTAGQYGYVPLGRHLVIIIGFSKMTYHLPTTDRYSGFATN